MKKENIIHRRYCPHCGFQNMSSNLKRLRCAACSEDFEHYHRVINRRDDLLKACEIGLDYAKGSNACAMPDCSVCKQKRENIKRIKQAIANATEEK